MIWLPISLTGDATIGTYKLFFSNISNINAFPDFNLPLTFKVEGKTISLEKLELDKNKKTVMLQLTLKENPLPLMAIIAGVAVLLGLGLGYMTISKVEKLIESPVIEIGVLAIAVLIIFAVFKYSIKK